MCQLLRIRRPKRNSLKKQQDRIAQRSDPRGYYESFLKYVKNNPIHRDCSEWLVNDIALLNKEEDCEKLPTPQNPLLKYDGESDDWWTDADESVDW